MSMITRLDNVVRDDIRKAYYGNEKVKSCKNIIDKSIKAEDLTTNQLATMLKAIGRFSPEETVNVPSSTPSKEEALKNFEITLKNRENALNNRETKLARQEKEFSEKSEAFDQKVKMLSEIQKKLAEKETKLRQLQSTLDQRKAQLDKRENELQQAESSLNRAALNAESNSEQHDSFFWNETDVSQQVTGIELRQSESTRLLSADLERSRLIFAAGKEICNKWLNVRQETLDLEKAWTEKLIYGFVQDFIKSNFPYCGKAVYDLVLYDLQKRREEINGKNSKD